MNDSVEAAAVDYTSPPPRSPVRRLSKSEKNRVTKMVSISRMLDQSCVKVQVDEEKQPEKYQIRSTQYISGGTGGANPGSISCAFARQHLMINSESDFYE